MTIPTVTFPGVELMRVGKWTGSDGQGNPIAVQIEPSWLESVLAASQDVDLDVPPLKLGHVDPRFDGQPAFGWVRNMRIVADRLLADVVGVPSKMAEVVQLAYKRRSPELRRNVTSPSGKKYEVVMSALSLLGATPPAVKGMPDLLGMFAEGDFVHMASSPVDVLRLDPASPLNSKLIDNDPASKILGKGSPMPIDEKKLRAALNLSETDDLDAALTAKLTLDPFAKLRTELKLGEKDDFEAEILKLAAAKPASKTDEKDEDVVKLSKGNYDELLLKAGQGADALREIRVAKAENAIDVALSQGRITPKDKEKWMKRLTEDFDGEMVRLGELAPGLRMNTEVTAKSYAGSSIDLSSSDEVTDESLANFLGRDIYDPPVKK